MLIITYNEKDKTHIIVLFMLQYLTSSFLSLFFNIFLMALLLPKT